MFAQMNLASDSSKSPQRLIMYLVAEATCYCQTRNLFLPPKRNAPLANEIFDNPPKALYTQLHATDSVAHSWSVLLARQMDEQRKKVQHGGMAERLKAVVLKTTVAVMSPGVRIPLPPPVNG